MSVAPSPCPRLLLLRPRTSHCSCSTQNRLLPPSPQAYRAPTPLPPRAREPQHLLRENHSGYTGRDEMRGNTLWRTPTTSPWTVYGERTVAQLTAVWPHVGVQNDAGRESGYLGFVRAARKACVA